MFKNGKTFKSIFKLHNVPLMLASGVSAVLFAMSLVSYSVLGDQFLITDFSDHIMSAATASNLDIGKLISQYYLLIIMLVLISTALFFALNYLFYRLGVNEADGRELKFIKDASLIGIAAIICTILISGTGTSLLYIVFAVIMTWIFIAVRKKWLKSLNYVMLEWSMLLSLPLTVLPCRFS